MRGADYDIDRVPLSSLKRYLTATRWHHRVLPSGLELFSDSRNQVEIVLPAKSDSPDIRLRLQGAIATLMSIYRQSVDEVISAIRAISYDLVLSRLPSSAIRNDTIRLSVAEEFVRRMTRILASSAHAELHPAPYFLRIDSTAQRYADECRFGHTFRGSFGFTVESPVGPNSGEVPTEEAPAPPLERRAIRRLARGLKIIESAIAEGDPSVIVGQYRSGLNANACDDLAELVERTNIGEVKFEIVFSPEWGVPGDLSSKLDFEIGKARGIEIIREAAKGLRVVNEDKITTIEGKVRTLHSMENPSDLFSITGLQDVMIEWNSEEFGRRNVRVALGPQEYLQAVEAHKAGRDVSVTGELEQGARLRLENPREFLVR
jgi:hypothetical protein